MRESGFVGTPMMTRRKAASGLLLAALPSACVTANEQSPHSPLWLIERDGGRVYIFGHTPPRSTDWNEPAIAAIAAACDVCWVETNTSTRGDLQALVMRYGVESGPALSERLSGEDWSRVEAALALTHVPGDAIAPFRPWLAAQTLEEASYTASGLPGRGAQIIIADQYQAAGKNVESEFATQDDVVEWFGAMTPTQDLQFLRYTLDNILAPAEAEEAKFDAWLSGDVRPAYAWMAQMKQRYPELYAAIVVQRNANWIARIEAMLAARRPALVITGLYHLAGPDNLPQLLAASGFDARRVTA